MRWAGIFGTSCFTVRREPSTRPVSRSLPSSPSNRALASLMRESQAEVIELPAWPESVTEWREAIQALQGLRGIVLFEENGGIAEMLSIIGLAQALPGRPVTLALATRELLHVSGTAPRAGALAGKRCFASPSAGRWGGCRPEY